MSACKESKVLPTLPWRPGLFADVKSFVLCGKRCDHTCSLRRFCLCAAGLGLSPKESWVYASSGSADGSHRRDLGDDASDAPLKTESPSPNKHAQASNVAETKADVYAGARAGAEKSSGKKDANVDGWLGNTSRLYLQLQQQVDAALKARSARDMVNREISRHLAARHPLAETAQPRALSISLAPAPFFLGKLEQVQLINASEASTRPGSASPASTVSTSATSDLTSLAVSDISECSSPTDTPLDSPGVAVGLGQPAKNVKSNEYNMS